MAPFSRMYRGESSFLLKVEGGYPKRWEGCGAAVGLNLLLRVRGRNIHQASLRYL